MKTKLLILFAVILFTIRTMSTEIELPFSGKAVSTGLELVTPENVQATAITINPYDYSIMNAPALVDLTAGVATITMPSSTAENALAGYYLTDTVNVWQKIASNTADTSAAFTPAITLVDTAFATDATYVIALKNESPMYIVPATYTTQYYGHDSAAGTYAIGADFDGYCYVNAPMTGGLELDAQTASGGYLWRTITELTDASSVISDAGSTNLLTITMTTGRRVPSGAKIYISDCTITGTLATTYKALLQYHEFTTTATGATTFTISFGSGDWTDEDITSTTLDFYISDIDTTQGAMIYDRDASKIYPIATTKIQGGKKWFGFIGTAPLATSDIDIIKPKPPVIAPGQSGTFTLPAWGDSVNFSIYTMYPYQTADAAGNYVSGTVTYE